MNSAPGVSGYASPAYAESLREFGRPRLLSRSGGWLLERNIFTRGDRDGMGCYPLFSCVNWSGLVQDVDEIAGDLVAISVVTDPFGDYTENELRRAFPDVVRPFKEHLVTDLARGWLDGVSKHHRYYAERALQRVAVEICPRPADMLDDWCDLYQALIERHELRGIKAFSKYSFAGQLRVPGLVMFRAAEEGVIVGGHLWFVQGDVALSHLAAASARGYELMVAYALYWFALDYFASRVRWIDFGAGAGLRSKASDGLTRFKRGWTNDARMAYFCGRICDRQKYVELCQASHCTDTAYFPAYRAGEF